MNTTKETLKLFWQHAKRYPGYLAGIGVAVPLTVLAHQFLPPLIIASVLERLSTGQFTPGDWWGSFGTDILAYFGLAILGAIIGWRMVIWIAWQLDIKVESDMSGRIFNHLLKLDSNFHANNFGGSLVSQTSKFKSAFTTVADTTVYELYTLVIAVVLSSIILWPKAPTFVIAMLILVAFFVSTATFVSRRVRKLNTIEADESNKVTGVLADAITNIAAVKSFSAGKPEHTRFMKHVASWQKAGRNVLYAGLVQQSYFAAVTSVLGVASLTLGIVSVVVFKADVSVVFLVVAYANNIGQRLWEFAQHTLRNYNRALGDAKAMTEILHTEPAVQDAAKTEKPRITKGAIDFTNLQFTHAENSDALFNGLDLHIAAGKKIGLVGHSGSGKTSMTRLLLRFADVDGGSITIDGQDIRKITQDDLRRNIAYVPQEPLLFHRTLRENIAYGMPDATDEQVREAARKANAAEFIEKLPKGYKTEVGERGVKLSGGQRQRIAIARAILKDAPILVLDEATSALDSESERLIQAALWELMKGRTTIVIAHRLSTIQRMDEIVVLDDGKILEKGSHNALLKKGGTYAELWEHQSGGFIEE